MQEYLSVLVLAALPALGNMAGGLLAEAVTVSRKVLSIALHGATGIILAVVGMELMPEALRAEPPWVAVLAFVAGGGAYILIDRIADLAQERAEAGSHGARSAWAVFFGVAVDLFSDGLMIGTASTISLGLGLFLALGQVTADIPEGFATIAVFRSRGFSRRRRMLFSLLFAVPVLFGATIGFWLVRGQAEIYKLALLAFSAGLLVTVTVEEIVPQAHEGEDARLATVAFIAGFALFTLLSVYFE